MTELELCPFCGGEAETLTAESMHGGYLFGIMCNDCRSRGDVYDTEAEAIEAWNTRAAYETDGWFYLPKPKEQLFSYTTGFTFDDLSLKATGTVDVYALTNAVRKWQEEELNQHIVERICEVFKPERTCQIIGFDDGIDEGIDGEWHQYAVPQYDLSCGHSSQGTEAPNYCPSCGRKVVGE